MKGSIKLMAPAKPKAESVTNTYTAEEYERLMRCLFHSAVASDPLYTEMCRLADEAGIKRGKLADDRMLAGIRGR